MNVLLFGATGMVGSDVLQHCLEDANVESVVSIVRRSTESEHPKLREIVHSDFLDYTAIENELSAADMCLFCIGVYQNQVSKETFWEVTVGYLAALVSKFEEVKVDVRFCLFSAQGAKQNEKTPILFSKAKGRAERVLFASKLNESYAFRPGFIKPSRGTSLSGFALNLFNFAYRLFPSIGIDSDHLARVMLDIGISGSELKIFENRDLRLHMKGRRPQEKFS